MLARCWYGASRFFHVRRLVPVEVHDLDEPLPSRLVADDEPPARQLLEQAVDVGLVVRQDFDLDALRAVLEAPRAVGDAPQAGE